MGILVTSDYLLNYYSTSVPTGSYYMKQNIDIFKQKFFGISGSLSGSLQYVSGSEDSAYFDKNIIYTFTGSTSQEMSALIWAKDNIGFEEGIYLTMSIHNTATNTSKIYKCDTRWETQEPYSSAIASASLYPPSSPFTSKEELLLYLTSSEYISASNK